MGQSPEDDDQLDADLDTDDVEETDDTDKKEKQNPRVKELSDENARRRNSEKNLQKQLEAAQVELKKHEDATKSETQRVTDELTATNKKNAVLLELTQQLQVENAFLANRKFSWRNPKTALKLLDRSEVNVDEDGVMSGLDDAIKKLADAEPYLLTGKDEDDSDDDDSDEEDSLPTGQRTKRKKNQSSSNEELVSKFPALRR